MSIIQNGNIFQVDIDELVCDSKNSFLVDKDTSAYEYDFISESQAYQFRHPSVKREIVPINEATRKEILKEAEFKRKLRAKKLTCRYVGVTNDRGWIKFITNSQYTPGKKYFQYIKLAEAKDMKKFKDFKSREIIRLFLSGDLQCYCNCLRHDTQIKLLDGRIMSVEDMTLAFESGEDLWVYSVDEKGNFKPGKVSNVWITGKSKSFVRITLDNGKSLEITENHLILMRDGSYKAAKDISIGDSLMPLYFKDTENGYELVKHNSFPDSGWHSVYKDVAEECFSDNDYREARERSREEKIVIHHKNYNKKNNTPGNLALMGFHEHILFHAKFVMDRRKNDPIFREKLRKANLEHIRELNSNPTEALIKWREEFIRRGREYWKTDEARRKQAKVCSDVISKYWKNISPEELERRVKNGFNQTKEGKAFLSEMMTSYWANLDPEIKKERGRKANKIMTEASVRAFQNLSDSERQEIIRKRIATRYRKILDSMISDGICITEDNFKKYKRSQGERPLDAFGSLKNLLDYLGEPYSTYNHKVVSVDVINVPIEENVYDITVEKYHNFYVDAGCILHNCADYKYRQKYVAWGLGFGIFKELRFPKKTNPSLEGGVCKHLIAVLNIMMMNHMAIERDMLKSKFFKRKSQDAEYMKELKAKQAQRKSKKKNG